jgi:hypothetical protein
VIPWNRELHGGSFSTRFNFFFFLVVLEFQLRASCLLGRRLSHTSSPLFFFLQGHREGERCSDFLSYQAHLTALFISR